MVVSLRDSGDAYPRGVNGPRLAQGAEC